MIRREYKISSKKIEDLSRKLLRDVEKENMLPAEGYYLRLTGYEDLLDLAVEAGLTKLEFERMTFKNNSMDAHVDIERREGEFIVSCYLDSMIEEADVELFRIADKELMESIARINDFEESLLRDDVVEYYMSKTPEEVEEKFGTEVARMVGFEQKNAHHCFDLWEHTLHTVEAIDGEGVTEEQLRKLKVAAFFHDIGKPDVSKINEYTGQQVFYGHAARSVEVAKPILEKIGYSQREIEQLCFLIGHHDDFISYKSKIAPFLKNHEFIREISDETVAEKVIENMYDFENMGYDKDQIRAICYTIARDEKPEFRTKDGPIQIEVDMEEVCVKMTSGEYKKHYLPELEDYKMLLQLCKADARAQNEREEKLNNFRNIESSIENAYYNCRPVEYTFNEFLNHTKEIARKPHIICNDGTEYSIQAGRGYYSFPKVFGLTNYDEYEVCVIIPGDEEYEGLGFDEYLDSYCEKASSWRGEMSKYIKDENGNTIIKEEYDYEHIHNGQMNCYDYKIYENIPKSIVEDIIYKHGGLNRRVMTQRVLQAIKEAKEELANEHTSEEITEGISPREGEIQEVLNEAITEKTREDNNLEKPGEEQGDN